MARTGVCMVLSALFAGPLFGGFRVEHRDPVYHYIEVDPLIHRVIKGYCLDGGIAYGSMFYDTPWSHLWWGDGLADHHHEGGGAYLHQFVDLLDHEIDFLSCITAIQLQTMYYIDLTGRQIMTEHIGFHCPSSAYLQENLTDPGFENYTTIVDEYVEETISFLFDGFEVVQIHHYDHYITVQDVVYQPIAAIYIPEPASLALLALAGLAMLRRIR